MASKLSGNYISVPVGTSDPANTQGYMYYNSTSAVLKFNNGTSWVGIGLKDGSSSATAAPSAAAIKSVNPNAPSGVYWLSVPNVNSNSPFQCYCDFTMDGGVGYAIIFQQYFSRYEDGPYGTDMNSTSLTGTAGFQSEYRIAPANFVTYYNNGSGATRLIMYANAGGGSSASGLDSCTYNRWVRFSGPSNGTLKTWACDSYNQATNSASYLTWQGGTGTAWHAGGHGNTGGVNQITSGQNTNSYLLFENKCWAGTDPNHYWMVDSGSSSDAYYRANPEYGDSGILGACWGGMAIY